MTAAFRGLSAFLPTPATREGRVEIDALAILVERAVAAGVSSVAVMGSTGAYPFFDAAERLRAVSATVEAVAGRVPVIAGVGALRTDLACALARDAAAARADAVLLAPVSYQPLFDAEVAGLVGDVAGASALPLCLYNNPGTTKFTFSPALIAELAALPTVAAVKMPLPASDIAADLAELRAVVPGGFAMGYSNDLGLVDAVGAGADAFYSSLAGTLPAAFATLYAAAQAGTADELLPQFAPLFALIADFGGLRVSHAVARTQGLDIGDPPRPILPLGAEVMPRVEAAAEALSGL